MAGTRGVLRSRGPSLGRAFFGLVLIGASTLSPASGASLSWQPWSVELPGVPAAIVSTDLDGDGRLDLAIFVVGRQWGEQAVQEERRMDPVYGLIEVLTVVPALLDHREVWLFRGLEGGGFEAWGEPIPMPLSVISLQAGPPGIPLLALTDEGVAAVLPGEEPALKLLVADPPVLAGSGAFLPALDLLADVSGNGIPDLLLPARDAVAVYLGTGTGIEPEAAARLPPPGGSWSRGGALERRYPLPEARDVDGDGRIDLIWQHPDRGWGEATVIRSLGGGRFAEPQVVAWPREAAGRAVFLADITGDGRAELATTQELESDPGGGRSSMRREIREAESPRIELALHRLGPGLEPEEEPRGRFEAQGYAFAQGSSIELPGGFLDLDGDGRLDLVTMTLRISVSRLLGGLALGRVVLPVDFHVWCQQGDGSFRAVSGLDLSGHFRFDLQALKVRGMPVFAGDFNGDGRPDFVQLGRGREVTIHLGRPGCSFPSSPDARIRLRRPAEHLELVQVRDFDGDGRADLLVIHPGEAPEAGVSAPVRLEFHLSAGERGRRR